jgi:hypothetical protein
LSYILLARPMIYSAGRAVDMPRAVPCTALGALES